MYEVENSEQQVMNLEASAKMNPAMNVKPANLRKMLRAMAPKVDLKLPKKHAEVYQHNEKSLTTTFLGDYEINSYGTLSPRPCNYPYASILELPRRRPQPKVPKSKRPPNSSKASRRAAWGQLLLMKNPGYVFIGLYVIHVLVPGY